MRLWGEITQKMFPFVMDKVGKLDDDHKLFVAVCESVILKLPPLIRQATLTSYTPSEAYP